MALGPSVTLPLRDAEWVGGVEPEPEDEKLALGERKLLTEGHCEGVCVAQWLALLLPEARAGALPLEDTECVLEVEGEPEAERLALREKRLLAEGHCEPVCEAHWLALGLGLPLGPGGEAEAVPRWPMGAAAPPVALGQSVEEVEGEKLVEELVEELVEGGATHGVVEAVSEKEVVTCPPKGGSCFKSSSSSKGGRRRGILEIVQGAVTVSNERVSPALTAEKCWLG